LHPLKGKLSIDVDDQIGLGNLASAKVGGKPILVAFFEPADPGYGDAPRGDVKTLKEWRGFGAGRLSGLRFVPHNWRLFDGLSGSAAAKVCSDYITKVEAGGQRIVDVVEWDIETHDTAWQKDFLLGSAPDPNDQSTWTKGIRGRGGFLPDSTRTWTLGYRWGRPGVWTMEGRQSTNSSFAAVAAETGLLVGPQCYNGAMTQSWDLWFEIQTWCLNNNPDRPNGAQIPVTQMIPYYEARSRMGLAALQKAVEDRAIPDPFPALSILPVGANESVLFATSRLA
jgi:hypothetical protein